mgnify:CR=1 FL=1
MGLERITYGPAIAKIRIPDVTSDNVNASVSPIIRLTLALVILGSPTTSIDKH